MPEWMKLAMGGGGSVDFEITFFVERVHETFGESPVTVFARKLQEQDSPLEDRETLVVVANLTAAAGRERDQEVRDYFKKILRQPLPLVAAPDPAGLYGSLVAEFPHFATEIQTILRDLAGQSVVRLRPTLLVGDPGCGKSRLARRLSEELNLPYGLYPGATAGDSSFAGTPRRWKTGEPSLPLRLVRDSGIANPAVILDELEKAATGTYHGRLWDSLVGFLEPETAARFEDPYLQAPANLAAVNWIATANSLAGIPAPLLDRFRVLRMPPPTRAHLPALAAGMVTSVLERRGLDAHWAEPLTPEEMEVLRRNWAGGSLRLLLRLVEAVLDARDHAAPRH